MENNNNVRFQTFVLIVGIFIAVVGAAFTLVWAKVSKGGEDVVELKVGQGKLEVKVDILTSKIDSFLNHYDGYKK